MFDPRNPFTMPHPLKIDTAQQMMRSAYIGDLLKATLVDNHRLLTEARRAIKDAGDPPDLMERLTAPPPMVVSTLGPAGELQIGEPRPIHAADQAALAGEYAPAAGSPKAPHKERLQTTLKDLWRRDFDTRLTALKNEALARKRQP